MSHARHDHVSEAERQRWVDAVRDLYPEQADFGGGVATSVIIEHVGTDRHRTSVMRHLRECEELRTEWGTMPEGSHGGRRLGFVPREGDDGDG